MIRQQKIRLIRVVFLPLLARYLEAGFSWFEVKVKNRSSPIGRSISGLGVVSSGDEEEKSCCLSSTVPDTLENAIGYFDCSLNALILDGRTTVLPAFFPVATRLRMRFLVLRSMLALLSMNSNGILSYQNRGLHVPLERRFIALIAESQSRRCRLSARKID